MAKNVLPTLWSSVLPRFRMPPYAYYNLQFFVLLFTNGFFFEIFSENFCSCPVALLLIILNVTYFPAFLLKGKPIFQPRVGEKTNKQLLNKKNELFSTEFSCKSEARVTSIHKISTDRCLGICELAVIVAFDFYLPDFFLATKVLIGPPATSIWLLAA